ncbi:hypothetical protein TTRE_0000155601 [Trichuris trichiura]|uniref:Uncharacterized protein n=1 Tax=Trichuris trichiura TaxID=36087 RepID=A0A077YZ01_TRITR|nr:hypothetical protein TTRE_0000155601 [Trichuris trichiura]
MIDSSMLEGKSDLPSCTFGATSACSSAQFYPFTFNSIELFLPMEFVSNPSVFFGVLNANTWNCLDEVDKKRLKGLLPDCFNEEEKEKLALDVLGGRKNFFFGSPVVQFYRKLKVNENTFSSDDDDIAETVKYGTSTFNKAHDDISSMSTLGRLDSVDLDLYKPLGGNNMKRMLEEYRVLRKTHKDHPTLDFTDVTLENVIERSGLQQYFARMNERRTAVAFTLMK